jgi:hypothetical protein
MLASFDYPYGIDHRGRTAATSSEDHVRDMIEQLLLTEPGERVNRPDFGGGLRQLVFAPNSPELAATLTFSLRAALQLWLGDVISVEELTVTADDSKLSISITYTLRENGVQATTALERPL